MLQTKLLANVAMSFTVKSFLNVRVLVLAWRICCFHHNFYYLFPSVLPVIFIKTKPFISGEKLFEQKKSLQKFQNFLRKHRRPIPSIDVSLLHLRGTNKIYNILFKNINK